VLLGLVAAFAPATPAGAVTITEFSIEPGSPQNTHAPRYIDVGPDGNLWYTDGGTSSGIGRITPDGAAIPQIVDLNRPVDLVTQPDGTVFWSGDQGRGRRLPNGTIEMRSDSPEYAVALTPDGDVRWTTALSPSGKPTVCKLPAPPSFGGYNCVGDPTDVPGRITGMALGADGRLWTAGYEGNAVRRLKSNGLDSELKIDMPVPSGPARVALGPDGNIWVTMYDADAVDRFTPNGLRTRFPLSPGAKPGDIVTGPDGALWITEAGLNKVGRMTTAGALTNEFALPTAGTQVEGITAGPDGALWFTESATAKIGRLKLDPAQGGGGVTDSVAPLFLRRAAFSPRRFAVARGATPKSAKRARGSKLSFSLSEPAAVTIAIARPAAGRRVGKSCRKPTRGNRSRRHCTRYATVGTLKRDALQGGNSVAFSGRIGRKALRPGRYRARVRAKDAAGNASKRSDAKFTILG
jgi:virginiamycin B lyase